MLVKSSWVGSAWLYVVLIAVQLEPSHVYHTPTGHAWCWQVGGRRQGHVGEVAG